MDYFSKTIILHQIENGFSVHNKAISGICRLEREDGIFKCYLTFMNIEKKQDGEFYFCLIDQNKQLYTFEIGKQPIAFNQTLSVIPNIEKNFSVGLYFAQDNIPVLVAYSSFNGGESIVGMKKALYDKYIKMPIKPSFNEYEPKITVEDVEKVAKAKTNDEEIIKEIHSLYDDEAVATENYYVNDKEIQEKLDFIAKFENQHFEEDNNLNKQQSEADQSISEDIDNILKEIKNEEDNKNVFEEVAMALDTATDTLKSDKIDSIDDFLNSTKPIFENVSLNDIGEETKEENIEYSESSPYFAQVKEEISNVFNKFPEEKTLEKILPHSKFVKINYAEDKFYVIGVIYEMGKEKYICYGVPDKYSKNPPKELKGYCQFIPLSLFDLSGDGYWMMFQDAILGTCVKLK